MPDEQWLGNYPYHLGEYFVNVIGILCGPMNEMDQQILIHYSPLVIGIWDHLTIFPHK